MAKDFTATLKKIQGKEPETTKEPKQVKEEPITETIDFLNESIYPDASSKLKDIKNDPNKSSFTFKASSEVLSDLRALATIKKRTQAELIEEALVEYFKSNLQDYTKAIKMRKEYNL